MTSTGRNLALLVGCNYPNTKYELHGCQTDAVLMQQTLVNMFGFDPKCIELLIDKPSSTTMPTCAIIMAALNRMVDQARSGDVLFFHFSGHGTQLEPPTVPKTEEAIVCCDYNLITSVDFRVLVDKVPKGATFTILADSSHSGGLIDKEPGQIEAQPPPYDRTTAPVPVYRPKRIPYESLLQQLSSVTGLSDPNIGVHLLQMFGPEASLMFRLTPDHYPKPLPPDQGILLSGCRPGENCHDGPEDTGSAFSHAVQMIFKEKGRQATNREIVMWARDKIKILYNDQHPCLYCSDENAYAIFLTA